MAVISFCFRNREWRCSVNRRGVPTPIGELSYCPRDVVAQGPTRVATWDLEHMREFTESRPELRAKLLQIMSTDLAAKLHESITNKQVESESSVQSRRSTRSDRSPK